MFILFLLFIPADLCYTVIDYILSLESGEHMMGLNLFLYIMVFILGACLFSFLNVVIYRVPRKLNFLTGRSQCPACGHRLGAGDLVPLVSWLGLRGRCRYCQVRVSRRYPLVELLGGSLALVSLWRFGPGPQALLAFAFMTLLTAVALVDLDTMEIPNGFVLAAALLAVPAFGLFPAVSWGSRLLGLVAVSGVLLVITLLVPGAFGGGDIKLMAACGLFLGWKLSLLAFFLAVLGGGAYGVIVLARRQKGRKDHFAFGPFLCLGMLVALLWGEALLRGYWNLMF